MDDVRPRRTGKSWWLVVGLMVGLLGCERQDARVLVGQPARPYHLELTLEPAAPRAGQETQLRFRLLDAAGGQALSPLQILHERALHTFIVSHDLRVFAHTHHEDFFPLTDQDLRAASFHFPHVFPTAGEYMIVSEFTHKDRSWLKQFRVPVSGAGAPEDAAGDEPDLSRDKAFGPYRVSLRSSPDPPVAGHEVELVCVFSRDGTPVTDLGLYLGTEVHMASWRQDGEHFGHQHTYTPRMAALMNSMRTMADDPGHTAEMAARMNRMMVELMSGPASQVYTGPELPVHHVFPTAGLYKLFFETAPGGERLVADFIVRVVDYAEGRDTRIESIVALDGADS
ncbi:MAG: hypothetical protein J4F42_10225 [Desulfurellaceae bacterium]|nr:hypothetical protein [Desulfurellaceae bacterium]